MLINTSRLKFLFTAFVLILIDQIFKNAALAFLSSSQRLSSLVTLEIYKNYGIAFGIPVSAGGFYLMVFIFLAFLAHVRFWKYENQGKSEVFAFSLIFAGAAGNMIDRIRWGYIIDFISIKGILIFNLADVFIAVGTIMLLKKILIANRRFDKK